MSQLIELQDGGTFRPGETLRGRVLNIPDGPGTAELRLFWHTRGRGTEDLEVIGSKVLRSNDEFQFKLPLGPPSFSGNLVSVVWALELVDADGEAIDSCEFIMSPTGSVLLLGHVDEPRHSNRRVRIGPRRS